MSLGGLFKIVVVAAIFFAGFKVVPIIYKGTFGIRGVCKEYADQYKKYGREYVFKRIDESLDEKGMPADTREYSINVANDKVVIGIDYSDTADFFGKYAKTFNFSYECEGELKSVY